jgi:hypothetical protein
VVARQAMYRGDDQRVARLCDLFINVLPRSAIGPDRCIVLNIISYQGKRNQVLSVLQAATSCHPQLWRCVHCSLVCCVGGNRWAGLSMAS